MPIPTSDHRTPKLQIFIDDRPRTPLQTPMNHLRHTLHRHQT